MVKLVQYEKSGTFNVLYRIPAQNERRASSLFRRNKQSLPNVCGVPFDLFYRNNNRLKYPVSRCFRQIFLFPNEVIFHENVYPFVAGEAVPLARQTPNCIQHLTRLSQTRKSTDTFNDSRPRKNGLCKMSSFRS
jgi:hypothetical protein